MSARTRTGAVAVGGLILLAAASVASVLFGAESLPIGEVLANLGRVRDDAVAGIVTSRVDRTLIGVVVGACVAVAGTVLQGLTRNPIAEPGILGLNAGAALLVVIGIRAGLLDSVIDYVWTALVGVILAGALVHAISMTVPLRHQPMTTALGGAAIMAASSSIMVGLLVTDDTALDLFRYWQVGSVAGKDSSLILPILPFVIVGLLLTLTSGRTLNAMSLGDDVARALGQRVVLARGGALLGALLLTAAACALAGPIAFVGLAVPHLLRLVGGPEHSRLLLGSVLLGPALVVTADTLGRVIAPPGEIQVGVMTAVIGAPVLILLARRAVRR